jgi:undecaprenyl-diphosphatase
LLLIAFAFIADEVSESSTSVFDAAVREFFRNSAPRQDWFLEGVRDVTALGSYPVLTIVVASVVGYLLLTRQRASALLVLLAVLGGVAMNNIIKLGFARPRPEIIASAKVFSTSFPSGHATLSAITFLTLAAVLTRTTNSPLLRIYYLVVGSLLTIFVGLSRLLLGVHYATDVLAGWCLGVAWAFACWALMALLQRSRKIERPH